MKKSRSWMKRLAVLIMAMSIVVGSLIGVHAEEGIGSSSEIAISTSYKTDYFYEQETVFSDENPLVLGVDASSNRGQVSFQWYCNHTPIEGATANTYTINNLTLNSSTPNFVFRCEASDNEETVGQDFFLRYTINVQIDANGATYSRTMGEQTENERRHDGFGFVPGESFSDNDISITEPVYWAEREFLGWEVNHKSIVSDENGTWEEWLPASDTYLTTAEMLAAINTESTLYKAVWAGNDGDYGSSVHFDCFGGFVTVSNGGDNSWTMNNFGTFLQEQPNSSYTSQTGETFTDPVQEGFTFEGWLEFSMNNGQLISVDENGNYTVYTTEEVLNKQIPTYDVRYVAKWKEIEIDAYMQSGPGEVVGTEFETEDELHVLLGQDVGALAYAGTTALTLTKDITIPSGFEVYMNDQDLIIGSGVTMQSNGRVHCDELTVNGALEVNEHLDAMTGVTVNGEMILNRDVMAGNYLNVTGTMMVAEDQISMNYPATITGIDNIRFAQDWQMIRVEIPFASFAELTSNLSSLADNRIDHSRVIYNMWMHEEALNNASEFVFSDSITIPSYVEMHMNEKLSYVIAEGKTVTIDGAFNVNGKLTINGNLVNNGMLSIQHMQSQVGELIKGTNGVLSGEGEIQFHTDSNVSNWKNLFTGFNMDDYDVANQNTDPEGNTHTHIKNVAGLIKLGMPINLTWGTEYREQWHWDEESQEDVFDGYEIITKPGFTSWDTVTPDQAEIEIKIYRVGDTTPCAEGRWGFGPEFQPEHRSIDVFNISDLPSGTYYFTVQSLGDYKEYRNSDVATSGTYTYVNPGVQLDACTDLKWEDRNDEFINWSVWTDNADRLLIDGYQIEYYWCDTEDGEYEHIGGVGGRGGQHTEEPFPDWFLQERGTGFYKFKVRVLSADIEVACNSPWSDFSPALNVRDITGEVNRDLQNIINDVNTGVTVSAENIKAAVQEMDTRDLQTALLTDIENNGTTQMLADLEAKVGGAAPVVVTQEAQAFNANDVSIVGANLNNKADAAEKPIQLIVDKPEKDHVIPELYNSSVAVKFSMTLENVEDPENLEVPVKITLPIPENINPEFVEIFHYHADGTYEVLHPHVYENNGKFFADFVLTSFSDFAMTEHEHQWKDEPVDIVLPTCAEVGTEIYECKLEGCEETHWVEIPKLTEHANIIKVEAVAPSYFDYGNIECYMCEDCESVFLDAEGKNLVDVEEVLIPQLEIENNKAYSKGTSIELPKDALTDLETLNIKLKDVSAVLDAQMLRLITDDLRLEICLITSNELNDVQNQALKDMTIKEIVSAMMFSGSNKISDFEGGKVDIKIPFALANDTDASDYQVLYVAPDGEVEEIESAYVVENEQSFIVMTTDHFSEFVIVYNENDSSDDDNSSTGDGDSQLQPDDGNSSASQPDDKGESQPQPGDNSNSENSTDSGNSEPENNKLMGGNTGVDTGDHAQTMMYVMILLVAIVGLGVMLTMKKQIGKLNKK